jgi:Ca-activated chloride channel family protein
MMQLLPTLTDDEVTAIAPAPEAGLGALSTARGCLPLEALDVQARIDGLIARTTLTQTFVNAHAEPLEATYLFPLPDRAAVTRFRLEVAGRVIEGELKERGEARREYQQAIDAGHRAALTEEERPGVFTMKVGNLPPGERAIVRLELVGPLPYSGGEATFRFPLVVAPRYIPGTPLAGPSVGEGTSPDTDAVPDASRISPPVLLPGFPNPVRLSLRVEVPLSPLVLSHFRSSLHTLAEGEEGHTRVFRLHPGEGLNRDFILRFRLAQERVQTALTLQPDADGLGGTFLLTLVPPAAAGDETRPRDVVFVLDRSGSMAGWKMVAARRALGRMVDTLTERDRFAVLAFDSVMETPPELGTRLAAASDRNRFRAVEFLARIEARGGTEMAEPLARAVEELTSHADKGRDRILVLVTDGQVGNEDQLLRQLGARDREVRIFTLGIDRAVNAAFLQRLADLGKGGGSELVESEDRLDEVMDQVHRRIGAPVLTGLRLEPAGLRVVPGSVVPSRLPDLFADAPLLVLGRYRDMPEGALAVQGREAGGGMWLESVEGRIERRAALAPVWARGRLRELEDRYVTAAGDRTALEKEIVDTSLRFGVLCRFTAYVAVDHSEVVNPGGQVHGVVQPVEQPEGWETVTRGAFTGQLRSMSMALRSAAPACAAEAIDAKGEVMGARAVKKSMLAKQVLSELNADGRVSKKTQLAGEDAARHLTEETQGSSTGEVPPVSFDACPTSLLNEMRREVEKAIPSGPDMVTMGKLPQTPRAKKVIEYSIEEARNLNHTYVGPEHLLLGLLRVPECTAARTLVNLGFSLEEIRREVLQRLNQNRPEKSSPAGGSLPDVANPYASFTDQARQVLQLANQEAQRLNHEFISTEHILIALVREGGGIAAEVLVNLRRQVTPVQFEGSGSSPQPKDPGAAVRVAARPADDFWK